MVHLPQRAALRLCGAALIAAVVAACGDSSTDAKPMGTGAAGGAMGTGGTGTGGIGTGGIGTGGAGTGGAGMVAGEPKFAAIYMGIIADSTVGNCTFSVCHGGAPDTMANGGLHLDALDAAATYTALVGPVSTGMLCAGKTLVAPGKPDESLLMQKLRPNPMCGMRMPVGKVLNDAQLLQVETWIKNGALND